MNAVAIIPARLGASRFPGKPLARIHGIPMVGHCFFRTRLCRDLADVYVATCDREIAEYIQSSGGKVVMTSASHNRASDRTAEAMTHIEELSGDPVDVVVMVQGDEPLITPDVIGATLKHFDDESVNIVNIMSRLRSKEEFVDRNNVKVVVDRNMDAMYFSREPIPSPWKGTENLPMYMQVGVIAFRRDVLIRFNTMQESTLEKIESVDMNRVLEAGGKIRMVLTEMQTLGVDTPADLESVSALMAGDSLMRQYSGQQL